MIQIKQIVNPDNDLMRSRKLESLNYLRADIQCFGIELCSTLREKLDIKIGFEIVSRS